VTLKTQLNIITKILIITFLLTASAFGQINKCQTGIQGKSPKRIAWFTGTKGTGFWPMVENVMKASAKDLGVVLEVYYTTDPIKYVHKVQEVINRTKNPIDGVIFHNHKNLGEELLQRIELKGVPTMMFNAGFSFSANVGKPREKYSCWIGTMLPDDEKAGYQLAKALLGEAKKHPNMVHEGKIYMVALEGDRASNVSTLRIKGMKRALVEWEQNDDNPKVVLHQSFHSKWRRNLASIAFKLTQSRYPKVSVFWTASDSMALGVVDAAKELGQIPGKDFVTGGMDLLPSTLKYLDKGDIAASVGAHYIEGAFALIALYDYLNGYDFSVVGQNEFLTNMAVRIGKFEQTLSIDNKAINRRLNKIDFASLSNSHTGRNVPYKLDTQAILNKLW